MRNGYHPSLERDRPETLKGQGFYKSPAWKRIRAQALIRDHYVCQLRLSSKCTGIATEVHHIMSLEGHPDLGLSLDNLISCCWFCHEETKQRKQSVSVPGVRIIKISNGGND